jgi:ABC-type uncharacterized transport system permease subunit
MNMYDIAITVIGVVLATAFIIAVIVLLRELTAWFYKTNEILVVLKQIRDAQDEE